MITANTTFQFDLSLIIGNNEIDNFIHAKVISLSRLARDVVVKKSVEEAIDFIVLSAKIDRLPELIFIDVSALEEQSTKFFKWSEKLPAAIREKSKIIVLALEGEHYPYEKKYLTILKPMSTADVNKVAWRPL